MTRRTHLVSLAGLLAVALTLGSSVAQAQAPSIVMASTTSTEQSGLFSHLLPAFKQATGIDVKVVALGTGQALDTGRRGDADVLFVHDQVAEEKFVAEGFGVKRLPVMYNDFVLVGPANDPAKTRGKDIVYALQKVANTQAGLDNKGSGYKECGCGMGPALNIASSTGADALTDRGTWLNFKNRQDLQILVEGDKSLFNQYGVMVVNPAKHPHVKADLAQKFVDWVISPAGQASINGYKIGGEQLFFANANK